VQLNPRKAATHEGKIFSMYSVQKISQTEKNHKIIFMLVWEIKILKEKNDTLRITDSISLLSYIHMDMVANSLPLY
jgi:hypothetical protein